MTKSAEIQRTVLTLLSDGAQHTVQEMKAALAQDGAKAAFISCTVC